VRVEDLVVIRRERWHRRNSYIFLFKNAISLLRKKKKKKSLEKKIYAISLEGTFSFWGFDILTAYLINFFPPHHTAVT
jgi:hypothetical protein